MYKKELQPKPQEVLGKVIQVNVRDREDEKEPGSKPQT
uniref:Uncharacterized protein n=1 Tax=Cyanothece sp. (strain PCC 7425 / ATCC 29141) TaxID=395961 RepID=B8HM32_CYAP4